MVQNSEETQYFRVSIGFQRATCEFGDLDTGLRLFKPHEIYLERPAEDPAQTSHSIGVQYVSLVII